MWAVFVYFNTCVPWKAVVLANHIQSIVYCDVERPWLTLERALLAFYSFMCCTKESLWFDMNQYRVLGVSWLFTRITLSDVWHRKCSSGDTCLIHSVYFPVFIHYRLHNLLCSYSFVSYNSNSFSLYHKWSNLFPHEFDVFVVP